MGYNSNYTGEQVEELLQKIDNAVIPTKTSDLTNDSNFITETDADNRFLDKTEVSNTYSTKKEVSNLEAELKAKIDGITAGELTWNEVV